MPALEQGDPTEDDPPIPPPPNLPPTGGTYSQYSIKIPPEMQDQIKIFVQNYMKHGTKQYADEDRILNTCENAVKDPIK